MDIKNISELMIKDNSIKMDDINKMMSIGSISEDEIDQIFEYCKNNNIEIKYNETEKSAFNDESNESSNEGYDGSYSKLINDAKKVDIFTHEENMKYMKIFKDGGKDSKAALDKLIMGNSALVISIAKGYRDRGLDFEDLIQEGYLGLIKAINKFDISKGFTLSTYASYWIRQNIQRAIYDTGNTVRLPVHAVDIVTTIKKAYTEHKVLTGKAPTNEELAEKLNMNLRKVELYKQFISYSTPIYLDAPVGEDENSTVGDFYVDPKSANDIDTVENNSLEEIIEDILKDFSPREQLVIKMRFLQSCPETLETVGKELGVTRERIRQIEARALRRLRNPKYKNRLVSFVKDVY